VDNNCCRLHKAGTNDNKVKKLYNVHSVAI